jgi:chitin synthase
VELDGQFAGVFIAVKGILNAEAAIVASGGHFTVSDIFANRIFRNIVLSLVATFGLWLVASFMFFEVSFFRGQLFFFFFFEKESDDMFLLAWVD